MSRRSCKRWKPWPKRRPQTEKKYRPASRCAVDTAIRIEIEVQDDARDPQSKIDDKAQFHDLVGHTRSSFTGGVSDHQGVLKAAEGGRVAPCLRDEIGDIPLDIQGSQLSRAARARSYPPW